MIVQCLPFPAGVTLGEISYVGGKSDTWDGTGATRNISLTDLTGGSDTEAGAYDFVVLSFSVISSSSGDMDLAISGYTEHCDIYKDDTVTLNFGVFSKSMSISPDSDVTIPAIPLATGNNNWAHVRITVWRGVNLVTPMDVAVVTDSGIDAAAATSPAITPITAGATVVDTAAACVGNVLDLIAMGNPGGFSPFFTSTHGKGNSCMGGKAWSGSGAMGPYAHGGGAGTTACWAALQMALRPGSWTSPTFSSPSTISSDSGFYGEGDTLSVSYTHDGLDDEIQWKRDGVAIGGATSSTYLLDAADVGAMITATVTASNPAGSTPSTSVGVGPIVTPTYATETRTLSDSSNRTLSDTTDRTISNRIA